MFISYVYLGATLISLARSGDLINITLEVSEQIYNATLQILGTEMDMTESNNTAYANITVLENSQNGHVAFNITAYDAAGNEFNLTQNNASANVIIDTVNPESSNLTIYSNNPHNISLATLGNILNITITANENLSSAEIMLLNDTYEMNITGQIAYASMMINASHADGQVEFNITAFDLAGNSLTVNQTNLNSPNLTIDKNVPGVINLGLYSNNSNSSLARAGDLINITIELSEQIYNATLQILGTEMDMTESNNTAYANITVLQNSQNGPVVFNITAYDGAGNEFNVTQNDASANVIIDTVDPTLSNLTIYSNNSRTDYAMAGHLLNITITANEALKAANVTVFGITHMMIVTGTTASANVTVNETSPEGDVLFNITAFDLAGNNLTVTQTNLNSQNLTIDRTNPTISNLTIYSNNTHDTSLATLGDTLNITITANENLSSAEITILNSTYAMNITGQIANASVIVNASHADGQVEFNITTFDLAGNNLTVTQANLNSQNLTIDRTNPTISNLTIYSNNIHNTSLATLGDTLNITITANENLSSAEIMLLNSTYAMNITGQIANASVIVNASHADGQVEFNITTFDLAGNSLTVTQANLNSPDLTIDKNVPSVMNLSLYSNNSDPSLARAGDLINITLEVSEQIYNATLQILGTEMDMTESNNTAYANITVLENSQNGHVAFNITAYDAAGNEFNLTQNNASANVIIDTVNPESSNLTIYSNNPHNISLATLGNILNITITANENLSSAEIMLLNDTYEMNITGQIAYASMMINASHADGQVEFNITAFDLAGNSLTVNQTNLNSPNLTIDKNVPGVINLGLYSNNSNSSLARAGDLINITIELSEQIYNATLQILGTEMDMTESNNTAYANITVLQNSQNGPVVFNITAYDGAGNEFNVTQNDASANVIIDTVISISVPRICKVAL